MRKNKYNNTRCEADGYKFDSLKERNRYYELKLLKASGEIEEFELQKSYKLFGRYRYVCDFFVQWVNGDKKVEDVKGFKTQVYKLKKAWMKDKYDIDIIEI